MSDIVERLNSSYAMLGDPLHKEAAEEIERFKNQLSHIIEQNNPQIENANSYFKSLEEELARCNKIIDEYEEEHSKLREALEHYSCDCTAAWQCPPTMLQDCDCGYVARTTLGGEKK